MHMNGGGEYVARPPAPQRVGANEDRHRPTMSRDHEFFAALYPREQGTKASARLGCRH